MVTEIFKQVHAEIDRAEAENLIVSQLRGRLARLEERLVAELEPAEHAVEEGVGDAERVVETWVAKVEGATSHADLHKLAAELDLHVPADPADAWGGAKKVAEKKAVLQPVAAVKDEASAEPVVAPDGQ